jgi:hypothetical protein
MFEVYVPNVSSISDVYCKYFYLNVAKVDLDVVYTYMLQTYLSNVLGISYVCCECFIWMLRIFAMTFECDLVVFAIVFRSATSWCRVESLQVSPGISSRLLKRIRLAFCVAPGRTCVQKGAQVIYDNYIGSTRFVVTRTPPTYTYVGVPVRKEFRVKATKFPAVLHIAQLQL